MIGMPLAIAAHNVSEQMDFADADAVKPDCQFCVVSFEF
jgi:hypothetical protein